MPQPHDDAAAGDEAFLHLNALLSEVQEARAAVGLARRRARQVLAETGQLVRHLRRLPVLHVELGDTPEGRVIANALQQRRGLVPATVAAAALELPRRPEDYLVGRSMQAVRTGVNHARRHGLSVLRVSDDGERRARALELVGQVGADFDPPLREWASGPHGDSWFVLNASSATRAIMVVDVDGAVARLDTVISAHGADQSWARHLLAAEAFMDLARDGVQHVVLEGALFLPPGLLHFQRRLGFRQVNIRLRPAPVPAAGSAAPAAGGRRLPSPVPRDAA